MFEPRKVARARRAEWHCMFHGDGIHRDVRRPPFRRAPRTRSNRRQVLGDRPPSMFTRLAELASSFAPSGSAQCEPSGRVAATLARCTQRSAVPPTPTADDGRRTGLAAGVEHAVDDERLDRIDAFGGYCHAQPGIVLRARALGDHVRSESDSSSEKSMWITGMPRRRSVARSCAVMG